MTQEMPYSQACENNKSPILERLSVVFNHPATILEIGCGTGQHAVYFASHLPHLTWLPTDHPRNYQLCLPRLAESDLANVKQPMALDVNETDWALPPINGAFSANTAHIMSWDEVEHMLSGVAAALASGEAFCLYGPFKYAGEHTSKSNAQFDHDLRQRNPAMGIRDVDDLKNLAQKYRMTLSEDFKMPANNRMLVWRRN